MTPIGYFLKLSHKIPIHTSNMFRSEDMHLLLFYFNKDTAKTCLREIGYAKLVHLIDLNRGNKAEDLPYTEEIRRLERVISRMQFLLEEVGRDEDGKYVDQYLTLDVLEKSVEKHFTRLLHLRDISKGTTASLRIILEDLTALEDLDRYLSHASAPEFLDECKKNLQYLCVISPSGRSPLLHRVLCTKLRRNIIVENYFHSYASHDLMHLYPKPDQSHTFNVYLIFTHGDKAIQKAKEICEGLGSRTMDNAMVRKGRLKLRATLAEIRRVYNNNHQRMEEEMMIIKRNYDCWNRNLIRELRTYQAMNKLRVEKGRDLLMGEGFVRRVDMDKLRNVLKGISTKGCFIGIELLKNYSLREGETQDLVIDIDEDNQEDDRYEKTSNNKSEKISNNKSEKIINNKNDKTTNNKNDIISNNKNEETSNDRYEKVTNKESNINKETNTNNSSNNQPIPSSPYQTLEFMEIPILKKPKYPPTYFRTNRITSSFQNLANIYGIPMYKEINPGLFYITTFPFMFGCMFGDIGHGLVLLGLSYYLIRNEKKMKVPEFLKMIFQGRYIMLFCSLWAIFFGFIYSDFLSLPVQLFPSGYSIANNFKKGEYTYPFGVDPRWHHSPKGIIFMNSLKMKMSVILGFIHMSFGVFLSYLNIKYRKDKILYYCVWIPQTLSFFSFVGYIVFLIFCKWLSTSKDDHSLITVLVSMYTSPFSVSKPMFYMQKEIQLLLLCFIIISLPWMLLSKPLYETLHLRKMRKERIKEEDEEEENKNMNEDIELIAKNDGKVKKNVEQNKLNKGKKNDNDDENEEETLVDIWMHQCIETIEFGIGLISNTSSYLRLWAISLAHSQLTSVLHDMTIGSKKILFKIISFPIWLIFTFALLVGLEGLSACLHALRLNWIEFNGKFYKGGGYLFEPLNFDVEEE